MKLLDSLIIHGSNGKKIQLYQGDLTEISESDRFDLLVVSAFPNDYTPTQSSLIGALHQKGLSVQQLSAHKAVDLRLNYACWLSEEFTPKHPDLKFRQILCFEPAHKGAPPEVVGDIFRALAPIILEKKEIKTIAMPVVAAGDQNYPVETIFASLLDAAIHWLELGLSLDAIKIVVYAEDDVEKLCQLLSKKKKEYLEIELNSKIYEKNQHEDIKYDVFISYSHNNFKESNILENALREINPEIRIFIDKNELSVGASWYPEILGSLDKSRKMVALLSPDYLQSKMCKDEFATAWIIGHKIETDFIFPIYIYNAELPTYMVTRQYFDCREGQTAKIAEAAKKLLDSLG